jgi:hypothetical protein
MALAASLPTVFVKKVSSMVSASWKVLLDDARTLTVKQRVFHKSSRARTGGWRTDLVGRTAE